MRKYPWFWLVEKWSLAERKSSSSRSQINSVIGWDFPAGISTGYQRYFSLHQNFAWEQSLLIVVTGILHLGCSRPFYRRSAQALHRQLVVADREQHDISLRPHSSSIHKDEFKIARVSTSELSAATVHSFISPQSRLNVRLSSFSTPIDLEIIFPGAVGSIGKYTWDILRKVSKY